MDKRMRFNNIRFPLNMQNMMTLFPNIKQYIDIIMPLKKIQRPYIIPIKIIFHNTINNQNTMRLYLLIKFQ
jgi:hypothetical protein